MNPESPLPQRTWRISALSQMNFSLAAGLSLASEQTTMLQLRCTQDVAWQITLDEGLHAQAANRFMAMGAERIGYELYSDPGHSSRWGNTQNTAVSGTGTGDMQTLTVYGQVPAQTSPPPGNYQDTITVTLTY
ncbi:spore coat U domain-containing protein [Stenotrophomonas sp.]|uniref:Csu type fimbrial protein n=1 Tax=Stenotrophomonas sp. TaxID=69392 RepID=UPI0028A8A0D5|nr:spore coat U domain-containing protein [Stenotrophomonas sp.]